MDNQNKVWLLPAYPELRGNNSVPYNFKYTRLYCAFVDEEGNPDIPPEKEINVVIADSYQTNQYFLNGGHYKPISKMILIPIDHEPECDK